MDLCGQQDRMRQTKNKQISIKIFSCFLVIVFVTALICCNPSAKKGSHLIRLMDGLAEKNIIQSPLKNIITKFNFVEENLTGKWTYLPELSSQNQEIWGTSSGYPILGNHDSEFPEGMNLQNDGQYVEYLSTGKNQKIGWRWIGTGETLDLRGFDGYDKSKRGIILDKDNSFRFEKLFPKGDLILDLYLVNSDWKKTQPRLTVSINGSDSEELVIARKKWFRVRKKLTLGKYTITIKLRDTNTPDALKTHLVLGQVKMTGTSDTLLLTHPRQQNRLEPGGEFIFRYYTYAALPGQKIRAVRPELLYLYNIRNKYLLHDSGTEPNPFSIKKKIPFNEYSLNCLAAPPKSEFGVDVKIPPNAVLEFGYGILKEFKNRESKQSIQFRLVLKQSDNEETLFDKTISWATTKNILREKIDLSPYAGKRMRVFFQTNDSSPKTKKENSSTIVPVWVNPIIYQIPKQRQANIILISLDTVRPDHLSSYGYGKNTSPFIDRLAAESVLFKNTYSTTSWTLPGHISLLTSLNCLHHQVYFPLQKMSPDTPILADILRTKQYYCAAFTGGGYLSETYGFSKGFDTYQEIKLHGDQAIRLDEAERLAELASRWLEDNKDKKFFLFLHTYQPHDPYANMSPAGKEFLDKDAEWDRVKMETLFAGKGRFHTQLSEKARQNIIGLYDGEIKYTDRYFVRPILDKLKKLGLYEKSLIILTSDHGEEFYDHEAWLHDHSLYNEGIKIPLIMKFPDAEHKGIRIEETARITDILPTILDQMSIKTGPLQLDGASLLPLLKGKEKVQRTFITDLALRDFEMAPTVISMNKNNFKFILNKKVSSPHVKRLVRNFDGSQIELYDLEKDPKETKNLAANITYREMCFEFLDKINRLYEQANLMKKERDEIILDQSLRERLKALGYIK